jgi:hypothetical protein
MLIRLLIGSLLLIALPVHAAKPLTVAELHQFLLAQNQEKTSDGKEAERIDALQLSEQLTDATLESWKAEMQLRPKSALALRLLADSSAMLMPPGHELPQKAAPGNAEIQAMLQAAVHYVVTNMHQLPNFLATRETWRFDDEPGVNPNGNTHVPPALRLSGSSREELTYRNGEEVDAESARSGKKNEAKAGPPLGLISQGEFGLILATVLRDAAHGKIAFSRREETPAGEAAVFRFEIPAAASHYLVDYCCVLELNKTGDAALSLHAPSDPREIPGNAYHGTPAYHGELFVAPDSGAILRLNLESELRPTDPVLQSFVAIRYAAVEIGGKSYICPARSLAMMRVRVLIPGETAERIVRRINETSFTDYHRFGTNVTILPAETLP